jgi:hypothetical protein
MTTPYVTALSCGCFFSGREFHADPSCAEHTDPRTTGAITMIKYEICPERDTFLIQRPSYAGPNDTCFEGCDEDDAEVWAVYDMRDPDSFGEWVQDFDSRAAAEAFCKTHFAD